MNAAVSPPPVTLDNCALEPIHIPGLVQPHGALFAFDGDGTLAHLSSNALELLGDCTPELGQVCSAGMFGANAIVWASIRDASRSDEADESRSSTEVLLNGRSFDLVVHRFAGMTIAEFEMRASTHLDPDGFAGNALKAMDLLKHRRTIDDLLAVAVVGVRRLTGFDRVMAYRFRHDDSGEIAAEDKCSELPPFLGLRYPAGDIPAQARRLYLINTIRLITDVDAIPAALTGASRHASSLDMSYCVLRSVSPIHLEYLRNIGVGASMSISVVVEGRLWGMIACHHRSAHHVPYAVRMACDVLAQLLAANVQSLSTRQLLLDAEKGSEMRRRLMESVLQSDDPGAAVASIAPLLMEAFAADAVVIAEDNRLRIVGELSEELAARVIGWLDDDRAPGYDVFSCDSASEHPAQLGQFDGWCGILALRYDELSSGWIVLLRKEQLETVNWGDTPRHVFPSGPHGVRLTPQGSTAVWQETVRGTSSPWTLSQMALSRSMSNELARVGASRVAELTRARTYLLGMLGHDLRDPLQAIAMATRVLEKDDKVASGAGARFVKSISRSAGRMARLIAQILDASRLQTRADLTMFKERIDVSRLLLDLIDEAQVAYPTITILHDAMPPVFAFIDGDRMSQLIGNLLSNARQYGTRGEPIIVHLAKQADEVLIEVSNAAPPIDAELLPHLFSAFRRAASSNSRNKTGLGLGLHIAQAVAKGHNGHIEYRYISDCVMFSLRFPTADRRTDRGTTPIAAT